MLIRLHRCCCSLSFPTPDNSTTMAGEENLHAPPLLPSPHYSNTAPPQIPARPPLVPAACVKALTLPCCSARAAMAMHRTRVLLTSYRAGCFLMYKCKHTNASRPRNWLMELSFLCHNLAANDSLVLYAWVEFFHFSSGNVLSVVLLSLPSGWAMYWVNVGNWKMKLPIKEKSKYKRGFSV